jgi:hypothetical protein
MRQYPYQGGGGQGGFPFPGGGGQGGFPFPGGGGQGGSPFPGGGGQGGFPFPGGGGQGGSPFPGGGQQGGGGAPTSPPPSITPQENVSLMAVDPGSIRGCLYRFTYVWLNNRNSFWFYPTYVGRTSVAGYRWRGRNWVYYGTDLNRIRSFQCY